LKYYKKVIKEVEERKTFGTFNSLLAGFGNTSY
jgi:hypothetical protein